VDLFGPAFCSNRSSSPITMSGTRKSSLPNSDSILGTCLIGFETKTIRKLVSHRTFMLEGYSRSDKSPSFRNPPAYRNPALWHKAHRFFQLYFYLAIADARHCSYRGRSSDVESERLLHLDGLYLYHVSSADGRVEEMGFNRNVLNVLWKSTRLANYGAYKLITLCIGGIELCPDCDQSTRLYSFNQASTGAKGGDVRGYWLVLAFLFIHQPGPNFYFVVDVKFSLH